MGQTMGFNYSTLGYETVQDMFEAMTSGIRPQIGGMISYIENTPKCLEGLREEDYVLFASAYNGPGQAERYGGAIENAADAYDRVTP